MVEADVGLDPGLAQPQVARVEVLEARVLEGAVVQPGARVLLGVVARSPGTRAARCGGWPRRWRARRRRRPGSCTSAPTSGAVPVDHLLQARRLQVDVVERGLDRCRSSGLLLWVVVGRWTSAGRRRARAGRRGSGAGRRRRSRAARARRGRRASSSQARRAAVDVRRSVEAHEPRAQRSSAWSVLGVEACARIAVAHDQREPAARPGRRAARLPPCSGAPARRAGRRAGPRRSRAVEAAAGERGERHRRRGPPRADAASRSAAFSGSSSQSARPSSIAKAMTHSFCGWRSGSSVSSRRRRRARRAARGRASRRGSPRRGGRRTAPGRGTAASGAPRRRRAARGRARIRSASSERNS